MRSVRWLVLGLLLLALAGVALARPGRARRGSGVIPLGRYPSAIAVDGPAGHAFIADALADTVTMVDTASGAVLRTVVVGRAPSAVAVDPRTGRAFVLNGGDDSVSLLATRTGTVLRAISLPNAVALAVDEDSGHVVVVSNSYASPGQVTLLDARSGRLLRRVPVGGALGLVLGGLAIDGPAHRVVLTNCADGTVSVLDTVSGGVVGTRRVGGCPAGVAVDERTGHAVVTNKSDAQVRLLAVRTAAVVDTVPLRQPATDVAAEERSGHVVVFSYDHNASPADMIVSVLEARRGALLATRLLTATDPQAFSVGVSALAADPPRERLFVLLGSSRDPPAPAMQGSLIVLDARNGRVQRRVAVGGVPAALAVDESSGHLFVVTQAAGGAPSAGRGQSTWKWVPTWVRRWIPWLSQTPASVAHGHMTLLDLSHL